MDYWDAIDYILALPDLERFSSGAAGQTMSLEAMKALLALLGHPERGRKTIHITGSKGKGSTSTMIASILHEAGYKTAVYTSPHLHDYVERLSYEMLPVSRFDFAEGVEEIRDAVDRINTSDLGPISTFGVLTALFFHLCRQKGTEWQVVEVGLGGTHDATNVFQSKEVAVITAISLEHTAILGDTCEAIAKEKAGIITPGCYAVLAHQKDPSVCDVIRRECQARPAHLVDAGKYIVHPVAHDANGQSFQIQSPTRTHKLHTSMLGVHQLENAATAVAAADACNHFGANLNEWNLEDGIGNAEITGRMEQLASHPLTVVDGAHNGESMCALVDAIDRHFDFEDSIFVVGANSDKNIADMVEHIARLQPKLVVATRSQSEKAMDPQRIADTVCQAGLNARVTQSTGDAIGIAKEFAADDDLICVTGSLYVAGEARQLILALPAMH